MSQNEFSEKCGFCRQYISLIESGKRTPSMDFLLKVAKTFNMNFKELVNAFIEKITYYEKLQ